MIEPLNWDSSLFHRTVGRIEAGPITTSVHRWMPMLLHFDLIYVFVPPDSSQLNEE
jgi:hypothetical protein